MTPRDTRTGYVLEQMILPALERGQYAYELQVDIGDRFGTGRHRVDVVATADGHEIPISLKWQQVSGTAEQKVPYEIICLAQAIDASGGRFDKAYLVLGGAGWKLRECFVEGELDEYLSGCDRVIVIPLEEFVALANGQQL
jgi:hypothetical protein